MSSPRLRPKSPNRAPSAVTLMLPPGPDVRGTQARRDTGRAAPGPPLRPAATSRQGERASAPCEAPLPKRGPAHNTQAPAPQSLRPPHARPRPRRPGPAPPPVPTRQQDRAPPGPAPVGRGPSLSQSVVWRSVTPAVRAWGPLLPAPACGRAPGAPAAMLPGINARS